MLRKLLLCLVVALVATATLASSVALSVAPAAAPAVLSHEAATRDELAGRSIGQLIHQGMTDERFEARVQHWLEQHQLDHPQRADLGGASPLAVAQSKVQLEPRAGRTVEEWVQLGRAENLLSLEPQAQRAPADVVDEVARLAAALGVTYTPAELADMRAQAAALPADMRAPFAALVASVADAHVAQAPIAQGIVGRMGEGDLAFMMTSQEREATVANALSLVAAQNAFRVAVAGVEMPSLVTPAFADPAGLVILGSSADDTFERTGVFRDAALIVDPAGNDVYEQLAGGACPDLLGLIHECNGLVVSMVVDLLGDDRYLYDGIPTNSQGSGSLGGIGLLVDLAGSDLYYSLFRQTQNVGSLWGGVTGYIDGGNQGYALAGFGLLLDGAGDDTYEGDVTSVPGQRSISIWGFSQGVGNAGGVGIASDGTGDDRWLAYGIDGGMRAGGGFQGLYPGGSGFFGGLGLMTDTGLGHDKYYAWDNGTTTDFYAYGFGAFGGTGIFYEDGGDDDYQAVESATNPFIVPLLNCAFGTASFAGLGVFLEMGGNDHYFGDSVSPYRTATMNEGFGGPAEGEGLFVDVSGDDGHFMEAHSGFVNNYQHTYGRGILLGGGEGATGNTFGVYLDLAGADQYTGAPPSRNNAIWPAGLDLEAGMVPEFFVS